MNIQLRDYQQQGVNEIRDRFRSGDRNVLFCLPTGGGKTVVFSHITESAAANGNRVTILVHRAELIRQTSSSLSDIGVAHGVIAPGYTPSWDMVQVASVQTLVKRLDKVHPPQLIISDECFTAGTVIAPGIPIENVKAGDMVTAYSERDGKFHQKKVVATFKNPAPTSLIEITAAGRSVTCTSNHPFLTKRGWITAENLKGDDYVYIDKSNLCPVRQGVRYNDEKPERQAESGQECLLQNRVQQNLLPGSIKCNDGKDQPGTCFCQDDCEQSDGQSRNTGKDDGNIDPDRTQALDPRRERQGYDGPATSVVLGDTAVLAGIRCKNKNIQRERPAYSLQDRPSSAVPSTGGRGGRRITRDNYRERTGHEKGSLFIWTRLDRIALLEQTGIGGHNNLPGDGFVYNFEVEDCHTYVANGFVVHNCHHAGAASWGKIFSHFDKASILGVTATPCRLDGKGLGRVSGGFFDSMVTGPTVAELIERKFLAQPRIYAPPGGADLSGLRKKYGEFVSGEVSELMDKPIITGCAVDHYRKLCNGVPAIAFCASVKHAEHVAEQFRASGFRAASIDGTMKDGERKALITALGTGALNVLTSCDIISEGTDIPIVGAAILLRPTASMGLYLQQVGRALRMYDGKTEAIILDHVGNTMRHGLPEEDREWTLDGERQGKKAKKEDEKDFKVKQCEQCYAVHVPAPKCPVCGFVYTASAREIEQADGELVEIDQKRLQQIEADRAKMFARREEGQATSLEDFQAIAKARGYNPGWAKHRMAARNMRQGARA